MEEIKNLHELLHSFLDKYTTILDCHIKLLEMDCENYGSIMLDLKVILKTEQEETVLNLIAKVRPKSEYLRRVFPTEVCFKNEINVYKYIIPYLLQFQKEQGLDELINFFPYCYATRTSIKNNDNEVDDDVVLLLENLKLKGYVVVNRMESFNLESTFFILKNLATYHAVCLSLKLLQPELFQTHVLNKLVKRVKFDSLSKDSERKLIQLAIKAADNDSLVQRIENALNYYFNTYKEPFTPREPFATLIHNDYWITNIMVKYENDSVVQTKMIDFQRVEYGSPARDLIFFIFTSVKLEILDLYYDDFIKYYYNVFIEVLTKFKCNTTMFSFKDFKEELRLSASTREFCHLILMTQYVHANKNTKITDNYTEEDHFSQMQVTDMCLTRLNKIIYLFAKNNWI